MRPSHPNPLAQIPPALRPRLRCAIAMLLEALNSARAARSDPWEFAVEIADLRSAGVTTTALRLLVNKGYVQHAIEKTRPGGRRRVFGKMGGLLFSGKTCFVLTDAGAGEARLLLAEVPFYDRERRKLWWRGLLVKGFPHPAPDQETILSSFQELGWPPHIDDPLPKRPGKDPKLRLRDAIHRLNQHQENRLIRFRGDGTGRGIFWEFVEEQDA